MRALAFLLLALATTGCGQYLCQRFPSTCDRQEPYGDACENISWYASRGFEPQTQDWYSKCQ